MNVYILLIKDTTQSKESFRPAHLEWGTDVTQRPHLPRLSNCGPGESSSLGLASNESKQNPMDKRDLVRKSSSSNLKNSSLQKGLEVFPLYCCIIFLDHPWWALLHYVQFTSLEVYPVLDVFPCSTTPPWATLSSILSLDATRAKVSFAVVSQARTGCRKQEIHSEREWKPWWKGVGHLLEGAKRTLHRENWGEKKVKRRKRKLGLGTCWCQLTQQCCSLKLYWSCQRSEHISAYYLGCFLAF